MTTLMTRRAFVGRVMAGTAAGLAGSWWSKVGQAAVPSRKFTMDLVCGAIGVQANQREAIRLARQHGFESVAPSAGELAKLTDAQAEALTGELREARLSWGAAGLPVDFRKDEATFRAGASELPAVAKGLTRAGVTRVSTWLRPTDDSLTYLANFRQHQRRLGEVARILGDHQLRFGLEYVGPKTSWTAGRFPFVHTLTEARELLEAIGRPNVGLVLDSWHWYTAHETPEDLRRLANKDIVACDLNDAPAGVEIDAQVDGRRELPAATGVIDLKAFLGALVEIGYDGPVRAEPFHRELNALPNEEAVAATAAALKKAFALVG